MTKRRASRKKRPDRSQSPFFKIPFHRLQNPFQPFTLISEEEVEQLHDASMTILEEVGLDFLDEETLDIWEKAGAI
ncbi:MAG: trimethylamine methyltransferase family protein, partial [Chloroflexota bacterium]